MKHLKIFGLLTAAFLMLFSYSCTKVDTEKGKEKLDLATNSIIQEINLASESNLKYALADMFSLDYGPFDKSFFMEYSEKALLIGQTTQDLVKKEFAKVTNEKLGDEEFDFNGHCGTYTWNATNDSWDYTSAPSDQIILIFPSQNSSTNDCKLVWTNYKEIKTNDGTYLPSEFNAELYYNDEKVAYLNFTISYDLEEEYPISADIEFFMDPFLFTLKYTFENNILTAESKIKAKGYLKESLETEITFKDINSDDKEPVAGKGEFKIYDYDNNLLNNVVLKIVYDFDYTTLDMDNATCDQINDNTSIELYTSAGRLIGEVICAEEDDCGAIIVFNDGTTEPVCTYFDRIEQAAEDVYEPEK